MEKTANKYKQRQRQTICAKQFNERAAGWLAFNGTFSNVRLYLLSMAICFWSSPDCVLWWCENI